MRILIASTVIAATALAGAGCGKSEEAKKAEEAKAAAEQGAQSVEKSAEQAAKGLEALAKGLGAMVGGDTKPVEPVSFRELQTVFPALDGWEMSKPRGEKMSSPVSFSQSEVVYTKGDSRIEAKVIDSGFNAILLTPYSMFLAAGFERESSDGYEKSTTVGGSPGWEKWNSENKDGSLNALVAKRFVVTFEGNNIDDMAVLRQAVERANLSKLAGLK